ncbi:MAG: tetratricopeptide repeat protein [Bacteroidota bacterium]|nr:tetratricopeptide repeat protein [Bacteroidota bacterium]
MGSSGLHPRTEAFNKAKDYTLKAIELNPQHAESHLSLAAIQFFQNWDFKDAETSLIKAIDLGLHSSLLNQLHGMIQISRGNFDDAIEKMNAALSMDPLSLPLMSYLADAYGFSKRFDEALALYDKIIELDATFRRAFEGKGYIYIAQGDYENAIINLRHYQSLIGHPLKGLSALAHAYAAGGYNDLAQECLEKMKQRQLEEPGVNFDLDFAFLYSGFKDFDKVFYHLDQTYEQRMGIACTGILYCVRYAMLGEMRSDPRFPMLLKKIGLE